MRLPQALKDKILDLRLRDKLVENGTLTKQQVEEYLKSLPDESSSLTYTGNAEDYLDRGNH